MRSSSRTAEPTARLPNASRGGNVYAALDRRRTARVALHVSPSIAASSAATLLVAAALAALALGRRPASERVAAALVATALVRVGEFVARAAYDATPSAGVVVGSALAGVVLVDALRRPGRP
jgi:hypothetical protein